MKDPKSAVVVGLFHNSLTSLLHCRWLNFWLTVQTGISDPELVLDSHSSPLVMSEFFLMNENSMDSIPADKVLKRKHVDLQKRFPKNHVSQMLGGPSLRLGIPIERHSIPPGTGWGGNDTGWLATWECPLCTDSAFGKSLESFIQLISFCNSWILPVISKIVSRSSTHFLHEIVSNVEPWNRFNSSISLRLFSWASRRSQFFSNNCSWRSCWSRRSCSIISFNFLNTSSVIIGLEFVLSYLRLTINENLFPSSVQESPNLFAFRVFSKFSWWRSWLLSRQTTGYPFYHDWLTTTTDRTTSLLQSDRLVWPMVTSS